MTIEALELRRVVVPLVAPFRTATGAHTTVEKLLVRAMTTTGSGWGECPVGLGPGSLEAVERLWAKWRRSAPTTAALPRPVAAAVETAALDADLRGRNSSLAAFLGATRSTVDAGVAVGLTGSLGELLDEVALRLAQGYRRVKLKIEPGWDVEPVAAVRERFGDGVALHVDGNGTYRRADAEQLGELDRFGLLMLEQPLPPDDLTGHAELARRIHTPVCLDEAIGSYADLERALTLGACSIVNVKPARLGGLRAAVRVHDTCVERAVPVWCGGMLETGIGRAANLALAALPGFTLPADLSASERYFETDLTEPFVLDDGRLAVPTGPGIGVDPLLDVVDACTVERATVEPPPELRSPPGPRARPQSPA
ncbi:MAG TPA: o-succinylbenzoate synthase [Acidimicrobiia bacterium]